MKKLLLGLTLLASMPSFANCNFYVESNSAELKRNGNSAYWAINKVMAEKGFYRTFDRNEADVKIDLAITINTESANTNFITTLKDILDSDNEGDAFLTTKRIMTVKVSTINGEILSGSKSTIDKSLNNYNEEADIQANKALVEAASLLGSMDSCGEL